MKKIILIMSAIMMMSCTSEELPRDNEFIPVVITPEVGTLNTPQWLQGTFVGDHFRECNPSIITPEKIYLDLNNGNIHELNAEYNFNYTNVESTAQNTNTFWLFWQGKKFVFHRSNENFRLKIIKDGQVFDYGIFYRQ